MHDWMAPPSLALWLRRFLVLMLLGCVGWGGALGQEDDDDDRRGVQDFSLSVSPSTGSVVQGSSRTYTVELSSIDSDGIDDEISLTISGLRTGLTETFSGSLSSPDTSTTLTIRASTSAAVGSGSFTVTGTADSGLTRTASASVTVTARQPTSFSITPSTVRLLESYTFRVGNAANMTLDLQYSLNGGATQTITGWPTLNSSGTASARPTLASQVGSYRFTAYRNTQASTWLSSNVSLRVLPALNPDFDLTVSPGSKKVYRGTSGTYAVRLDSIDEFSSPVTLSVSGLPSGVSHSFPSTSVTPTGSSTLTIDIGSSVSPGRYRFTVTGTGGGKTHTDTAEVVVPDFTLSISPQRANADRGSSVTFTVTITPQHGFSIPVTLSVSDLGTGLSGTLSRTSVTPTGTTTVTLTIRISCTAPRGAGTFTVRVTDGRVTKSVTGTVDVKGFSVSNSPEVRNLQRPGSVDYTVDADLDSGFLASVRLSISGLPSEVMHSFSPNPTRSTSRLRLTAGPTAPPGRHTFTVTGTAHGCTDDDSDDVIIVDPPPDPEFELSMTPESGDVDRGSSRTYTVTVDPDPGFTSDVDLSVSGLRSGLTWSFSTDPVNADTSPPWSSTLTVTAVSCSVSTLADSFMVTGTGGGHTDSDSDEVVPRTFSVSTSTENEDLERGSSVQYTVTVSPQSGFAASVALSVSGLPSEVTGDFNPTSTRSTSILTLRAMPNATLGRDTFTVTGTAHGCPVSTTDEVNVIDSDTPGFELSMIPESGDVDRGSSRTYDVEVDPETGFTSNVTLTVSELGTGLSGSFSRSPVTSSDWTSRLTLDTDCNASLGSDLFKVTGTGGNASDSDTDTVVVKGFSLSPPPVSVQLERGTSEGYTITVNPDSGFSSDVRLSVSGLPSGVRGSFSPTSTGSTSTLTLEADATATLGPDSFTVTGTAHGCAQSISVPIEITGSLFQMRMTTESANLQLAATVEYEVAVSPAPGFSSNVTLSVSDLPPGVTWIFSPNPVNASSATPWTSILTLTASPNAATGPANFTVTGTSGDFSASDTDTVVVTSTPICALTLDSQSVSVAAGSPGTLGVSVALTTVFGSSASFDLGVSGLPAGVTGIFVPVQVTPGGSDNESTLTLTATSAAPAGTGDFIITASGTSGGCTATGMIQVIGSSGFSLSPDPLMVSVAPGASQTSLVTVSAVGTFSSAVALAASGLPAGVMGIFAPPSVTPTAMDPTPTSTLTLDASASATPGTYSFTITGTAGALTQEILATVVVSEPEQTGSFTLSVTPARRGITKGDRGGFRVTVDRTDGFSAPVTLSVSGLSNKNTPSFSVNPVPESTARPQLTIVVGKNASSGDDEFTITGTAGTRTQSVTATVDVAAPGNRDFTLEVSPKRRLIDPGSSHTYAVSVPPIRGLSTPVELSIRDLAPGFTSRFSNSSISIGGSSKLTITAPDPAPPGEETFVIQGIAQFGSGFGAQTVRRATTAVAEVPSPPDFELSVSPTSNTIEPGAFRIYHVMVDRNSSFTSAVALSVSGLGNALTGGFSDELPPADSATTSNPTFTLPAEDSEVYLKVKVADTATSGNHQLTITGTGANLTRTAMVTVVVPGPDFSLSVSPWSKEVARAPSADASCTDTPYCSQTYTVTVNRLRDFSSPIELTVSGLRASVTGAFSPSTLSLQSGVPFSFYPTSTLTIIASSTASEGTMRLTVTGTSGQIVRSTSATVTVFIGRNCRCGDPWGATSSAIREESP